MVQFTFLNFPHDALRVLPRAQELTKDQLWQLVDSLYAPWRSMVDGSAALMMVALCCYWRSHALWFVLWAAMTFLILLPRLWGTRIYLARRQRHTLGMHHDSPHVWAGMFMFGAGATSTCWGVGAALVLATSHDPAIVTFVLMVVAGWVAGAGVRNNASPMVPASFLADDHSYRVISVFVVLQITANLNISQYLTGQTVSLLATERRMSELNARLTDANGELELANLRLHSLSATDPLTGIANRRAFDEALHREWGRAARNGAALALLVFDVDNFKAFNDFYGHPAGDACLCRIADTIEAGLRRPPDLAARFGGEEFVAILPGTSEAGACDVAERLRGDVEALAIAHLGTARGIVTISVGAACIYPRPGENEIDLVEAADQALYRAKQSGRNRVFPPPGCVREVVG